MRNREPIESEMDELLSGRQFLPVPPDRLKRIEAAVTADLKPVRPMASDGVYFAAFGGVFLAVWIIGCYMAGQRGWHALSDIQRIAVFAPLAVTTALLAFSVVRQMRPAAKYARSSARLSAGVFVLLLLIMPVIFQPARELAFVRNGMACFRTGMTFAIPAAFFFALLLLRGAALSPALIGATAGGLAGLVGLAVLEIHCPNLNVYHIVVWHVSVTLVCVVAGLIFSSVTFRRSTSNQ
jgi:hypothetical protein